MIFILARICCKSNRPNGPNKPNKLVTDSSSLVCYNQKFTPKLSDRLPLCEVSNVSWQMLDRPMS